MQMGRPSTRSGTGASPEADVEALVTGMGADVLAVRERLPMLPVSMLCDGAPEMWNLLDAEFDEDVRSRPPPDRLLPSHREARAGRDRTRRCGGGSRDDEAVEASTAQLQCSRRRDPRRGRGVRERARAGRRGPTRARCDHVPDEQQGPDELRFIAAPWSSDRERQCRGDLQEPRGDTHETRRLAVED